MDRETKMTAHHGEIDAEDVSHRVKAVANQWRVTLIHEPTRTLVEVTDQTVLIAREKAWIQLRDKLEGWT